MRLKNQEKTVKKEPYLKKFYIKKILWFRGQEGAKKLKIVHFICGLVNDAQY